MAQNKNNIDREQVDNMRQMLANENKEAVAHRYGEDALNSDEYQQAQRELHQRRQSEKEMRLEAMGVDEQGQDLAEETGEQDAGVDQDTEAQRQAEIQRQEEIERQRQQEEAERQQREEVQRQQQEQAEAQQQMDVAEQHEEQVVEQDDQQEEDEREHEVQQQDDQQDPPMSEARRRLQEDDRTLSAAHRDSARADREQDQEDDLSR